MSVCRGGGGGRTRPPRGSLKKATHLKKQQKGQVEGRGVRKGLERVGEVWSGLEQFGADRDAAMSISVPGSYGDFLGLDFSRKQPIDDATTIGQVGREGRRRQSMDYNHTELAQMASVSATRLDNINAGQHIFGIKHAGFGSQLYTVEGLRMMIAIQAMARYRERRNTTSVEGPVTKRPRFEELREFGGNITGDGAPKIDLLNIAELRKRLYYKGVTISEVDPNFDEREFPQPMGTFGTSLAPNGAQPYGNFNNPAMKSIALHIGGTTTTYLPAHAISAANYFHVVIKKVPVSQRLGGKVVMDSTAGSSFELDLPDDELIPEFFFYVSQTRFPKELAPISALSTKGALFPNDCPLFWDRIPDASTLEPKWKLERGIHFRIGHFKHYHAAPGETGDEQAALAHTSIAQIQTRDVVVLDITPLTATA